MGSIRQEEKAGEPKSKHFPYSPHLIYMNSSCLCLRQLSRAICKWLFYREALFCNNLMHIHTSCKNLSCCFFQLLLVILTSPILHDRGFLKLLAWLRQTQNSLPYFCSHSKALGCNQHWPIFGQPFWPSLQEVFKASALRHQGRNLPGWLLVVISLHSAPVF